MFLSWKNKQNVKVGLWKWKCTHIKKWWRPEFLPFFVMPDRRVDFKIQTSVLLCKVFFERLTINLLVTKSEEFWSCDKWNQKFEMVTTIIGWQEKEAKKEMVTSWLVLLLITSLLPATWSGPQQTGDRSKGELFSVFVHVNVNGIIHSIHQSQQQRWTREESEREK